MYIINTSNVYIIQMCVINNSNVYIIEILSIFYKLPSIIAFYAIFFFVYYHFNIIFAFCKHIQMYFATFSFKYH